MGAVVAVFDETEVPGLVVVHLSLAHHREVVALVCSFVVYIL